MPDYKNKNGEPFTEVEVAKYAEAAGMQLEDFIVKEGLTATEVVASEETDTPFTPGITKLPEEEVEEEKSSFVPDLVFDALEGSMNYLTDLKKKANKKRLEEVKKSKFTTEEDYQANIVKDLRNKAKDGYEITYGRTKSVEDLSENYNRYGVTFEEGGMFSGEVIATLHKGIRGMEEKYTIKVNRDKEPVKLRPGKYAVSVEEEVSASEEMAKFVEWMIETKKTPFKDAKNPYGIKTGSGGGGVQNFTTIEDYAKEQFKIEYGYFNEEDYKRDLKKRLETSKTTERISKGIGAEINIELDQKILALQGINTSFPADYRRDYDDLRFNALRDADKNDIKKYFGIDVSDDFIKRLGGFQGVNERGQPMNFGRLITDEDQQGFGSDKAKNKEFIKYLSDYSVMAREANPLNTINVNGEAHSYRGERELVIPKNHETLGQVFNLASVAPDNNAVHREFKKWFEASPELSREFNLRYTTQYVGNGSNNNSVPTYNEKKQGKFKYKQQYDTFKAKVVQNFLEYKSNQLKVLNKRINEAPVDNHEDFSSLINTLDVLQEKLPGLQEDYDKTLKEIKKLDADFKSGKTSKTQENVDYFNGVRNVLLKRQDKLNNAIEEFQKSATPNNLQLLDNAQELSRRSASASAQSMAFLKDTDYGAAYKEKIEDQKKTDEWYKNNPWLGQIPAIASSVYNALIPNTAAGLGSIEVGILTGLGVMSEEEGYFQKLAINDFTQNIKLPSSSAPVMGEGGFTDINWAQVLPTVSSTITDMYVMMNTGGVTYGVSKSLGKFALGKTAVSLSASTLKTSKNLISGVSTFTGSLPTLYNHNLTEAFGQVDDEFSIGDALDFAFIQTSGEALIELINPEYRYAKGIGLKNLRKKWKDGKLIDHLLSPTYTNLKAAGKAVVFENIEEFSQNAYHGMVSSNYNRAYNTNFEIPDANSYKETLLITTLSVLGMRGLSGNLVGGNQNGLMQVASENYNAFQKSLEQRMLLDKDHKQFLTPDQATALLEKVENYKLHAHLANEKMFDEKGVWTATNSQKEALVELLMTKSSLEAELETSAAGITEDLQKELNNVEQQIKNQRNTIKSTNDSHELSKLEHETNKLYNKLANLGSPYNANEIEKQSNKILEEIAKLGDKARVLRAETKEYQVNGKVFDNKADFIKEIKRFKQNGSLKKGAQLNIIVKNDVQAEAEANQALGKYAPVQSKEKVVMSTRQQTEAENFIGDKNEADITNDLNEELAKEEDKQNKIKVQKHKNALKYFYLKKSNYKFGEKGFLVKLAATGEVIETAQKIRLEKTIDFVENNKKFVGKDVIVAQDNASAQVAHDKARKEWNAKPENKNNQYPEKSVENTDGFVIGDFIVINKDIAGQTDQINVGAHELLHAVTDKYFDGLTKPKKVELIKSFRETLTKEQDAWIEGKINERGDLDITTTREWFTLLSDGITKNEISFNESVWKKIANFFHKLFRKNGVNKEFASGRQAYDFMKDYQKSVKKGEELSERAKKFYEATKDTKPVASVKVVPLSMSKEAVKQIEERVTEIGLTYNMEGGKKLWDEGGSKAAIDEITRDGLLDDLIASKYKVRPVPENFVKDVLAQLLPDIRGFNPEVNNDFGGYLGPRVNFRAGDVYKDIYEKKGPATVPTEAKTKEGEVKVQVEAETDVRAKAFETEDVSIAAQIKEAKAKKKAKEEGKKAVQLESEFRNEFGIKTNDKVYNKVLETARVALKRAYEVGTSVRNIQRKLAEEANTYKSPDGQKLYDIVLNKLGTKKAYFENLEKFRVPIVNLMFTADLVQMEREVADDKKIFTRFVKKLTTKAEVEAAVDQMLLPPSAIDSYTRDKSVNVYEKLMPTKDQFIAYFNQPLNIPNPKNPKTTKRSNVRGERKQALARRVVGGLVFDATMQVAQEPDVMQARESIAELKGEVIAKDDLQTLAAAIGRQAEVRFSRKEMPDSKQVALNLKDIESKGLHEYLLTVTDNKNISYRVALKEMINRTTNSIERIYKIPEVKSYLKQQRKNGNTKKNAVLLEEYVLRNFKSITNSDTFIELVLEEVAEGVNPDVSLKINGITLGLELKADVARGPARTIYLDIDGIINGEIVVAYNKQSLNPEKLESLIKQTIPGLQSLKKLLSEDFKIKKFNLSTKAGQEQTLIPEKAWNKIKQKRIDAEIASWTWVNSDFVAYDYLNKEIPSFYITMGAAGTFKLSDFDPLKIGDKVKDFGGVPVPITVRLVSTKSIKYPGFRRLALKVETQLDSRAFAKQDINLFKENDVKEVVANFSKSNLSNEKTKNKAVLFSRSVNNPTKGITVLDFDDTLATTKSKVKFTRPDGTTGTLNAEQYASTYESLAEQGYKFDFSEFNKVIKGKKAPLFEKALKLQSKFGPKNMFILTARPMEAGVAIHTFLKANGLNIPLDNITGLGNSTAKAKADWMVGKVSEGFNDFYFADDALQNVKAVQNVLNEFDVKSKVQQARVNFSKGASLEFNKIIKRTTGVPTQSKFSDVQAKIKGAKNKYFSIIPASAQDFGGLLYNFLGKGKQGEKDMAFFKKALIDPFARGIDELNTAKQKAAVEYKQILKDLPDTKKILNDNINDDFTVDQAVRVYLWNKAGYEIPGLSKRDLKMLDEYVKGDAELMEFAFEVGQISNNENGYSQPSEYWLTENIGSDLFSDGALGAARATHLTEWQENSDQIFSKENLNKIQAIYGDKFREALEDILYRMKTGRNRPSGSGRLANEYMNWVNGSVGAIMFFNIRSAALQTISATNYINWSDNNPLKAGAAFANQKQFWTDFTMLFNSDYLKQRRSGNQRSVSESELSQAVTGVGAYEQTKAAIRYLLKIGFKPTQIADSFAIASGGASFFRNRTKTYVKQGMSQAEAEAKAFLDFQETTEVSQQSARPDMISMQQASPLGRLILSFQNTPMQYARIMNKAARDLANGRGDYKTHVSKIAYYGVIQSIIFASLQSAVFATLGIEDDEEKDKVLNKKKDRILHTMLDSWLAGIGYGGKAVSTMKNTTLEYLKQRDKGFKSDHAYTILALLGFSPPIGSKVRKVYSSIQTEQFNKGVFTKRGFSLDNPIFSGIGNVVEGLTNLPTGRLAKKMLNLDNAMDTNNEWWQRVALVLGWSTWDLGIKDPDIEKARLDIKQEKKTVKEEKKKETKLIKLREKYPKKSDKQIQTLLKSKELFKLSKKEQVDLLKSLDINATRLKTEKQRTDAIAKLYEDNSEVIDGVLLKSSLKTKKEKEQDKKDYKKEEKNRIKTREIKTRKIIYR